MKNILELTNVLRSIKAGTTVRPLVTSELNEVAADVLANFNPLITVARHICVAGWDDPGPLIGQLRDAAVQPGEILLLVKGGGSIDGHGFKVICEKFTAENCTCIRTVLGCHLGVAIGHTNAKYRLPVHEFCTFWEETPSQLGFAVNALYEFCFEDPAVLDIYSQRVEIAQKPNSAPLFLELGSPPH